jgi:hypothetical protein
LPSDHRSPSSLFFHVSNASVSRATVRERRWNERVLHATQRSPVGGVLDRGNPKSQVMLGPNGVRKMFLEVRLRHSPTQRALLLRNSACGMVNALTTDSCRCEGDIRCGIERSRNKAEIADALTGLRSPRLGRRRKNP